MLDRVARLPGAPCLLARSTRLGGLAFCHVNGSSRATSANRGEIKPVNMAAKNRPVHGQDAEIRWKKVSLVGRYVCGS